MRLYFSWANIRFVPDAVSTGVWTDRTVDGLVGYADKLETVTYTFQVHNDWDITTSGPVNGRVRWHMNAAWTFLMSA